MESPKKNKLLEKFATTLLECTLHVDVKIGKTYKVEVTDDGFTVRKRRQKSEDGMHFRYENVDSCQANSEGNQLVLQILPTSLGSGGGCFRFKTKEAAKIVSLASRLGVVAAVRKEALRARTASGHSLPASPRSPGAGSRPGSPFTPAQNGGDLNGPAPLSPSHRSTASESTLPSSPDTNTSRSTTLAWASGDPPQGPKLESSGPPAKAVTPPKWTLSPTPYAEVRSSPRKSAAERKDDDVSKEALAAALRKELARSGSDQSSSRAAPSFSRQKSLDGAPGDPSRGSSKPSSAGSSKASSPKLAKHSSIFRNGSVESLTGGDKQSGAWAMEEGFRGSGRSSDDGSGFRVSSRLSPSGTPSLSRQGSAKGGYSRQSSLGSVSARVDGDKGIRLLPRVSSGSNPFLSDAFAEESPLGSGRASSLPPPPTSPKKGVFEGFEQFVKVASPRASSEGSRRASSDVASDVSRRSSDVTSRGGPPLDLLNGENDCCEPPIVVEITPRSANTVAPGGLLDAEFAPGTWALGSDWADVSSFSPTRGALTFEPGVTLPPAIDLVGTSPTRDPNPVPGFADRGQLQSVGGAVFCDRASLGASSAHEKVKNPLLGVLPIPGVGSPPISPAGNPFRAQYPDPFLAAFGADPGLDPLPVDSSREALGRSKSLNPFVDAQAERTANVSSQAQPSKAAFSAGMANPFAPEHRDLTASSETHRNSTAQKISHFPPATDRHIQQTACVSAPSKPVANPFAEPQPLSSQNGTLLRSRTQAALPKEAAWETFSAGNPPLTGTPNPGLTRSVTQPPTAFNNSSIARTGLAGVGVNGTAWESFNTIVGLENGVFDVKMLPAVAPVASLSGAETYNKIETVPDEWESFGRQRSISSRSRPHVVQ